MGTAWPQKYHSSRGHASAATVLAQPKTASSPVVVPSPLTPTLAPPLTPPPVSWFRPLCDDFRATEDEEPVTADAESAGSATTATATATTVPSVGPAGGRQRRRRRCRSVGNDRNPATVPVAAGLWQLSPWRPTGAGEDLDDRGSIKAVAATSGSATTNTTTTTTTMNASNHVTLNRFVRLTITLLITRILMLRLVQLRMLLASVAVLAVNSTVNRSADDKQPLHQNQQKQQQPNAAIQQTTNNNCTVSRRRSAPTTKTKGTDLEQQQRRQRLLRQPSDDCWPPSLYCYPVPAVVAILRIVATESVEMTAAAAAVVVRIDTKENEVERALKGRQRPQREGQRDLALECSEWCGCFCRHCSSLTCSRFFMEVSIPNFLPRCEHQST